MRNLNDLYNMQDAILLLEIVENRFQQMYHRITTTHEKIIQIVL